MADLAGIKGADVVLKPFGGTEFADDTSKPNINDGFETVTPRDGGTPLGDAGAGITTGLTTELQGPSGFNLPGSAAQNIVTDVNGAGLKGGGAMTFGAYDAHDIGGKASENFLTHDGLGVAGNERPEGNSPEGNL